MFIAQRDFERAMELVDRSECFYSHLVNKFVVIVEQIEYVQLGVKGVYLLWTVPPFVTAHTFCASRDIRVS